MYRALIRIRLRHSWERAAGVLRRTSSCMARGRAGEVHQVIERGNDGAVKRYRDLDVALAENANATESKDWRIHFHIPLHSAPTKLFQNTSDHIIGLFGLLQKDPTLCTHLEMETYTWEVMPPELKGRTVVEQLVSGGRKIYGVRVRTSTLEEVYVEAVGGETE